MQNIILNFINLSKKVYDSQMDVVANRYQIKLIDLDILLFLANNPKYNSAKDIIQMRKLTKSHVSTSIKELVNKGYLELYYQDNNHKTIHLNITSSARPIIEDGKKAQSSYIDALCEGFTLEERTLMQKNFMRILNNLNKQVKEN